MDRGDQGWDRTQNMQQMRVSWVGKDVFFQFLVRDVLLVDWTGEVVGEEFSQDVDAVLYESSETVHSLGFPFAAVVSTFAPLIRAQTLAFIFHEVTIVDIARDPSILPIAMFLPILEIALIVLPVLQHQSAPPLLDIIFPEPLVDIPVLIGIGPLKPEIILEAAEEGIAIEEGECAVGLLVVVPGAIEDGALAEVVEALAVFPALVEVAHVLVLVEVLEVALAVGEVVGELSGVDAAVAEDQSAPAVFLVLVELADVGVLGEFVEVVAVAVAVVVEPVALVEFLLREVQAGPVLFVFLPGAVVVGHAVVVVVDALALLAALLEQSVVDFSAGEHVDSLPVEEVVAPGTEVDVGFGVGVVALALADGGGVDLAHVESPVGVGDFDHVLEGFDALQEFGPLHVVVTQHLVFQGVVLAAECVHQLCLLLKQIQPNPLHFPPPLSLSLSLPFPALSLPLYWNSFHM